MDDLPKRQTPPKPWEGQVCALCGGGFSEQSWDERHTVPWGRCQGEDCHERCCPRPDCRKAYRERIAARKARKAKEAMKLPE